MFRYKRPVFLLIVFTVMPSFVMGIGNAVWPAAVVAYDSDSEDEPGYQYRGYDHLDIPEKCRKQAVVSYRDIHFSPTLFKTAQERSRMKRKDEVGKPIFSSAVYDVAGVKPTDNLDQTRMAALKKAAPQVKQSVTRLNEEGARDRFQQLYTNQYDKVHTELAKRVGMFAGFLSGKNPQVSTSESFRHAGKYGMGKKFLGTGLEMLDPEYDFNGKPKHPYLGKTYIILADTQDIKQLDPYFVACAHANNKIKIFNHYSNNILSEREVSFPGFIPGKHVVYAKPIRVPSFAGGYKPYYKKKYGIKQRSYKMLQGKLEEKKAKDALEKTENQRKRAVTVNTIMEKVLARTSQKLEKHVKKECKNHGITPVYKSLDDGFSENMPTIDEVKDKRLK